VNITTTYQELKKHWAKLNSQDKNHKNKRLEWKLFNRGTILSYGSLDNAPYIVGCGDGYHNRSSNRRYRVMVKRFKKSGIPILEKK
jgi:hypothetical protein